MEVLICVDVIVWDVAACYILVRIWSVLGVKSARPGLRHACGVTCRKPIDVYLFSLARSFFC